MPGQLVHIKDGNLSVDFASLVGGLSSQERDTILRYLVFDRNYIKDLMELVATGRITSDPDGDWWMPIDVVHQFRMQLLPLMNSLEAQTIKDLNRMLKESNEDRNRFMTQCWKYEKEIFELQRELKEASEAQKSPPEAPTNNERLSK